MFDALKAGAWDVAFLADDPARAVDIAFSPAYIEIEGAYLVPRDSPIRANADVDRAGTRVVVGRGSAYDLYLTREIKAATLVRAPTSPAVVDVMVADKLQVAAGVRQQLEADAKRVPNVRVLDGRFMVIRQAMGTPKAREAGARYVAAFVEDMKALGLRAARARAARRRGRLGPEIDRGQVANQRSQPDPWRKARQDSYLNESCIRARYATLPPSIFMSSFVTSAMRRSRSDLLATPTARFAASSHDVGLVPITSMTR